MEADRMTNVVRDDAAVRPERDVVLEGGWQRDDNDPGPRLAEQLEDEIGHRLAGVERLHVDVEVGVQALRSAQELPEPRRRVGLAA